MWKMKTNEKKRMRVCVFACIMESFCYCRGLLHKCSDDGKCGDLLELNKAPLVYAIKIGFNFTHESVLHIFPRCLFTRPPPPSLISTWQVRCDLPER
jgi:hypothetical protein